MLEDRFRKVGSSTPSLRGTKLLLRPFLWDGKFLKSETRGFLRSFGRNSYGLITVFHRGGGHKKLFRTVDFSRFTTKGVVEGIEYDPFRSAFLARVYDQVLKKHSYILAAKNLYKGSFVDSGDAASVSLGHALPLERIPVGSLVHNLCSSTGSQGQFARAAGAYAQLIQKVKGYARIRLMSGEQRMIPLDSYATLGVVSNEDYNLLRTGKAGRSRWLGRRPYVRGVAMNPVDHPHGGGEGKTSGGRPSVSPWGKPTKGPKTSSSKNPLIVVWRKKKRSI